MATEAQIRANQANAQKSTGPITEHGKARSARNAYRHGLCAQTMFFTCREQHQHFLTRCQEISDQYPFEHAMKETLVLALASAEHQIWFINWMKRGAAIHQSDIAVDQLWGAESTPKDPEGHFEMMTRLIGAAFMRDAADHDVLGKYNRYEAEQHRILHRALKDLENLYDKYKETAPAVPQTGEPSASAGGQPVHETNPISKPPTENKPLTEQVPKIQEEKPSQIKKDNDPPLPRVA